MRGIFRSTVAATALMAGAVCAQDGITIGMVLEPPNLDPTGVAAAATDEVVYANLFEGLTRFAYDGTIRPALARDWRIEDEGRSYVFDLQDGVTFHDGSVFDAEDVRFSLDRARAEDSTNAQKQLFAGIESVEIIDPLTVRIRLTQPDGNFPFKMAWGDAVMVAEESIGDIATAPIGTGPFRFDRWVQGDRVELSAYDGYWGEKPALERATFRFISDPTAAFAAVMAEDVDAFPNFPAPETLIQLEADPRFAVIVGTTEGETILAMNNAQAPLDDIRVRQAIAHAINRADIIDGAMFGYGTPIGSHFAPHHPDYLDLTDMSAHDPQRSRDLLAEVGSAPISLRLALPPPAYARRGGEIVAAQLRAVGIETRIVNMEWAQWLETVFKGGDYDLTIVSHTEPLDIDIYARPDYYFHYDGDRFHQLMDQLESAAQPHQRSELYQQAQRQIAQDYVNGFLFQLAKTGVANKRIEGLWVNAPTQANDLTDVRWGD
ncbi:ABC transporter substrate-binding protein [Paracoccus sp. Z330]|uniref:ABC transporter substrate-binding protein n=1 Tax=Paracoccus onchidii TaxID=3017813 RepID=A0ABT4ZB47_9RHOB|nr:ABC transporter substrate-binding protein [Paracoccus onchidii]MDB6176502.1 ABC transporter substrate-binding protein [Paracoccus onchidii]